MERRFYGVSTICDCLDVYFQNKKQGTSYSFHVGRACTYPYNHCIEVKSEKAFTMNTFDSKIICGKRGGASFLNAIRPDFENKLCPKGTLPCSNSTSLENTICYDD